MKVFYCPPLFDELLSLQRHLLNLICHSKFSIIRTNLFAFPMSRFYAEHLITGQVIGKNNEDIVK